jgi:hypothetical protein
MPSPRFGGVTQVDADARALPEVEQAGTVAGVHGAE